MKQSDVASWLCSPGSPPALARIWTQSAYIWGYSQEKIALILSTDWNMLRQTTQILADHFQRVAWHKVALSSVVMLGDEGRRKLFWGVSHKCRLFISFSPLLVPAIPSAQPQVPATAACPLRKHSPY